MGIRIIYLGANQQFRLVRWGVTIQREFPTLLRNSKERIRHTLTGGPVFSLTSPIKADSLSELRDLPALKSVPNGSRQLIICEENSFYPICPGDGLVNHEIEKYEREALQEEGAQASQSRQVRLREPNVMATVVSLISVATVAAIALLIVLVVVSSEIKDRGNDTGSPAASARIHTN